MRINQKKINIFSIENVDKDIGGSIKLDRVQLKYKAR